MNSAPSPTHRQALPDWLRYVWALTTPFAFLLALRLLWEKTFLTWERGPQMVGFSLMHLYPAIAILGILSSLLTVVWLLTAAVFLILRRKSISKADIFFFCFAAFIILLQAIPDDFFARQL